MKAVEVQALAEKKGLSIEMAARQARHEFFAEFNDAVIALAHHADDQVETFFLKLARGAGPDGLSGMDFSQKIGPIHLIRPLLNLPQSKIIEWLRKNQFVWREDASNLDESFLRNRVRHTLLPLLERELNSNLRETLLRTMDILREENAWMESLSPATTLEASSTLPIAAKRRALRKWLFEHGAENVRFDAVEKILELMKDGNGTTVFELNLHQRVIIEYSKPRFEEDPLPEEPSWALSSEHGTGWRQDPSNGIGILPAEASFDANKVGDAPITVRGFKPGDRIRPLGMKGSRKLQDIFTDQKVPRAQRSSTPVVCCRGEIIWIPGYRTAQDWEVPSSTAKAIHVRIEPNHSP